MKAIHSDALRLPNFRSFPGTRRYEKSPLGGLGRLNACPTNSTPGLVKVNEFSVGQAIAPGDSTCPFACELNFHSNFQETTGYPS